MCGEKKEFNFLRRFATANFVEGSIKTDSSTPLRSARNDSPSINKRQSTSTFQPKDVNSEIRIVQCFINSSTMRKMDIIYSNRFLHSLRSVEMTWGN